MIVNIETLKEQLRLDFDDDDILVERKIAAAQDHIERHLGFKIEEEYPVDVPPALGSRLNLASTK
ncbi:head-tail connector protein [Aquamicrobium sp.]|uniref:head-tail connector protein n=1 Tax=Aquamicrobium sp. TaxID=1872579 RepID=UPI0025891BA2|nr:head-tail connector protein [Aquamicrobium sp.]MCK9551229.1 head-tail connector protein [Aquamicrobium sp.]